MQQLVVLLLNDAQREIQQNGCMQTLEERASGDLEPSSMEACPRKGLAMRSWIVQMCRIGQPAPIPQSLETLNLPQQT